MARLSWLSATVVVLSIGLAGTFLSPSCGLADDPSTSSPEAKTAVVAGTCQDEVGEHLEGVKLQLLENRARTATLPAKVLETIHSDREGRFRFKTTIPELRDEASNYYCVTASTPNRSSAARMLSPRDKVTDKLTLALGPAGTLEGIVRDSQGKPVEGATVRGGVLDFGGVRSAVTDKEGRYRIADMSPFGTGRGNMRCNFTVDHPQLGLAKAEYNAIPKAVDVTLQRPVVIEGRVVDGETGDPIVDLTVFSQGQAKHWHTDAITDAMGRYRLRVPPDDAHNVMIHQKDRPAAAIEGVKGAEGETIAVEDMKLVAGGLIAGQFVDEATGKPVTFDPESKAVVMWHGPDRPRSSSGVNSVRIQADGSFLIRVPEGRVYPHYLGATLEKTRGGLGPTPGLLVKAGETLKFEAPLRISAKAAPLDRGAAPFQSGPPKRGDASSKGNFDGH
jgi:protocatechuate 3,4-dioxygenase beta subunit